VKPFIAHWNGTRWARVCTPEPPAPQPGSGEHVETALSGVSAGSPADVMVTGWYVTTDKADDTYYTEFTLHRNGRNWTRLPSPASASGGQLYGTSVISGNDVWAVGIATPDVGASGSLIQNWDGTHWTEVPSPY
jgi:hypothetical protein